MVPLQAQAMDPSAAVAGVSTNVGVVYLVLIPVIVQLIVPDATEAADIFDNWW